MACYFPLKAYYTGDKTAKGKRAVVVTKGDAVIASKYEALQLPCGRCIGCRLERSRQWAVRIVHEASLYDDNCFITLTYAPEYLPKNGTLVKKDFQDFIKRLRREIEPRRIRFFHCGEYGSLRGRPHYHAILFGFDFSDKRLDYTDLRGFKHYVSDSLDRIWGLGRTELGTVTFESAAYVARYIIDKVTGDDAFAHYNVDRATGEYLPRQSEYVTMSRKPGVGKPWLDKFLTDVYPHDSLVMRGREMKPPRYYDTQFELLDPAQYAVIKDRRVAASVKTAGDRTPERLKVRHEVQKSKLSRLKRTLK